jgi:hypothetical protein
MTVLQILLAILASSGFFSVILAILNRHWSKKDNKMSGLESIKAEIDQLKTILENHINEDREQDIRQARREILRFNDEVRRGVQHTEESFDDILECIDVYERYCDTHPAFENNKAVLAIGNLKRVYQDRLTHNDFL